MLTQIVKMHVRGVSYLERFIFMIHMCKVRGPAKNRIDVYDTKTDGWMRLEDFSAYSNRDIMNLKDSSIMVYPSQIFQDEQDSRMATVDIYTMNLDDHKQITRKVVPLELPEIQNGAFIQFEALT